MPIQTHLPSYISDYTACQAFDHGGRLVLGTSGIGGAWGEVNPTESIDTILYALNNGISAIDTAPSYVDAEKFVGQALKLWRGDTPFISTKVGRLRGEHAHDCKVDYSPETMRRSVYNSLEILGLSHIDLLFLHEPQLAPVENLQEIVDTLMSLKEEGVVKYLGIGGNPVEAFLPLIAKGNFKAVSGFLKLNACNLSAFEKDIPYFKKYQLAYYAASPLHFGLLGDRFSYYQKHGADGHGVREADIAKAQKVKGIAHKYDMALSTLAQRYLFSITEADRVVVGASNLSHIQSTLSDWKAGKLSRNIFDEISEVVG